MGIPACARKGLCILSILTAVGATAVPAQTVRAGRPVKVACIGNSITFGSGVADPRLNSYPSQLQRILGNGWEVRNFGLGGRTLLRKGDFPYWNEPVLEEAKSSTPDVVVIMLGTNDSKPQNWKHRDEFAGDYRDFLDLFIGLPSHPRVFACTPVPAYPGDWGISDSIIRNEIRPAIKTVAHENNVPVIDLYPALSGKPACFPDKVHPNEEGARLIAESVCRAIAPAAAVAPPPEPFGPRPTQRQLVWQELEYYGFVHFGINTFTDSEWGKGNEDPALFNPTELDCRQWAGIARKAGMKGIILTAKHHDGFCLWPSRFTDYSVKASPFRGGRGDVLRELSDACKKEGLRFGVYISPWDRHENAYGDSPRYNTFYMNQLREVLTSYGNVFEVWFDGACGEGPNGKRQVYDWPGYVGVVRECQPGAVIFSDAGPDVRWVGNENGFAGETCWSLLRRDEVYPGYERYAELTAGHADGTSWVPPECDVSIRPGWFYHRDQDDKVKDAATLLQIYCASVGRNGSLLLNVPVDRRGLIAPADSARLMEFRARRDSLFAHPLLHLSHATASSVRGNDLRYGAGATTDGQSDTYWATDDSVKTGWVQFDFSVPTEFNCAVIQEYIPLGQRIEEFSIEIWSGSEWKSIAAGTTIGHKRIMQFPSVTSDRVRVRVIRSRACPAVSSVEVYHSSGTMSNPSK